MENCEASSISLINITLIQRSRSWIRIQIETDSVCLQISASSVFDPFEELYIWLGQIRDSQLPAKMIIDEEGSGVTLIAKENDNQTIEFIIEKCVFNDKLPMPIYLQSTMKAKALIQSFYNGITNFIKDRYSIEDSSFVVLSNINWDALLRQPAKLPDWKTRLAMYGGGQGQYIQTGIETVQLTEEQKNLYELRNILHHISTCGNYKLRVLVDLYKTLPIDIALGELDSNWYKKRREEIYREYEILSEKKQIRKKEEKQRLRNLQIARLNTLRIGQLVDGTVAALRYYGLFVNIGGIHALLHISMISKMPVEDLKQIFQPSDWVRAIVVNLDIEKGRVTLSTKDLESKPGDMLKKSIMVYQNAEKMAKIYRLNHGLE